MKVLVVGSINKDIVFQVDSIVSDGETISAFHQNEYIGGKGFNQFLALSKSFPDVYLYANLNEYDTEIINYFKVNNLNLDYVQLVNQKTGTAFIQVDNNGENAIVISKNANGLIDVQKLDNILSNHSFDYIVLQNEVNDIDEIVNIISDKGIKIILNPSPVTKNISIDLIKKVDLLFVNEHELKSITNHSDIEMAIDFISNELPTKEVIVTMGNQGSLYLKNHKRIHQDAFLVKVVDTTCAGDTFLGYFIGCYLQDYSIEKCMYVATKAASICITSDGASNSIPNSNQVFKKD